MNTKRFLIIAGALATSLALPFGGTVKANEFFAIQSQGGSSASDLTIMVRGIETQQGEVRVGLYDNAADYEDGYEIRGQTVAVTGSTTKIVFEDLPVGRYAAKVFHDVDSDGALDKNGLGIPSEPYGFSNNASDPFSAPEWIEARFTLPRGQMVQTIDLN